MKKLAALMVAGLMALSLAACGNTSTNPSVAPSGDPSASPAQSGEPSASLTGNSSVSLDAALKATFVSGYLAEGENDAKVLIAATADGSKAVVISDSGESQAILFGTAAQTDEGKLTVTDDATGEKFVCTFTQNEEGRVVIALEDGTKMAVQTIDAAAVTSALQELAQ
jgi:hypothetical protein